MARVYSVFVLLLVSSLLIAAPSDAASAGADMGETVWAHRGRHSSEYLVIRPAQQGWRAELVVQRRGKLPVKLWSRSFAEQPRAVRFAERLLQKWGLGRGAVYRLTETEKARPPRALTELPGASLWEVKESWSWEWEQRYAEWVSAVLTPDFAEKYRLETDCADLAYAMRWIFARDHGLPAANRLTGGGVLFTQDSMKAEWAALPTAPEWHNDQRFRAALNYLLDLSYTHTLGRDSYPIAIRPDSLIAGTHHLYLHETSGHTYVVNKVDVSEESTQPLQVTFSTTPRQVRALMQSGYWEPNQPKVGGFLKFLWPVRGGDQQWTLAAAGEMPHFSREQYEPEFMKDKPSFAEAILLRLNSKLDYRKRLADGIRVLQDQLGARREIVERGFELCQREDCSENTQNYEDWSTPSRDRRLLEVMGQLENLVNALAPRFPDFYKMWSQALASQALILGDVTYPLEAVIAAWKYGTYSVDPRQSIAERWGLAPEVFAGATARKLQALLTEREQLLTRNPDLCSGYRCSPESASWMESQSFELDAKLLRYGPVRTDYCAAFGAVPGACERFAGQLSSLLLTGNGESRSLADWLTRFIWFNADPRASRADRWGAKGDRYRSMVVSGGDRLEVSTNGLALATPLLQGAGSATDTLTGQRIAPPAGFVISKLDTDTGILLATRSTLAELRVVAYRASQEGAKWGDELVFSSVGFPRLSWIAPGVAAVSYSASPDRPATRDLVDFDVSPPKVLRDLPAPGEMTFFMGVGGFEQVSGAWLHETPTGGVELLHYRDGALTRLPLKSPFPPTHHFIAIQWETKAYYGVVHVESQGNGPGMRFLGTAVINKQTGEVTAPWEGNFWLSPTQDGKHAFVLRADETYSRVFSEWVELNDDLSYRVLFSARGNPTTILPVGKAAALVKLQGNDRMVYRFAPEGVTEVPLESGERSYDMLATGACTIKLEDGRTRVRRWSDRAVLYEGNDEVRLYGTNAGPASGEYFALIRPLERWASLFDIAAAGEPLLTFVSPPQAGPTDSVLVPLSPGDAVRRGALLRLGFDMKLWLDRR